MCNLETEGVKHGCGHYRVTKATRKIDCGNRYCSKSARHPNPCHPCHCDKFYGPDVKEVIVGHDPEYCDSCHYYYRGPGRTAPPR